MGVVWAARQPSLSRIVAVKRLAEPPFNPRDVGALLSEGRITGPSSTRPSFPFTSCNSPPMVPRCSS